MRGPYRPRPHKPRNLQTTQPSNYAPLPQFVSDNRSKAAAEAKPRLLQNTPNCVCVEIFHRKCGHFDLMVVLQEHSDNLSSNRHETL